PEHWYFSGAGGPATGPSNPDFLRDIGVIHLVVGAAFLLGPARRQYRVILRAPAPLSSGAHALFHCWRSAVGICAPSVLARACPAVTLPAAIGTLLTLWAVRDAQTDRDVRNP